MLPLRHQDRQEPAGERCGRDRVDPVFDDVAARAAQL